MESLHRPVDQVLLPQAQQFHTHAQIRQNELNSHLKQMTVQYHWLLNPEWQLVVYDPLWMLEMSLLSFHWNFVSHISPCQQLLHTLHHLLPQQQCEQLCLLESVHETEDKVAELCHKMEIGKYTGVLAWCCRKQRESSSQWWTCYRLVLLSRMVGC